MATSVAEPQVAEPQAVAAQPSQMEAPAPVEGKESKPKPGRKAKKAYPVPETGLTAVPEDFDRFSHRPLKEEQFADPVMYWDFRISEAKKQIAEAEEQKEQLGKFGDARMRQAFASMSSKLGTVEKDLKRLAGEGVDTEALLQALGEQLFGSK